MSATVYDRAASRNTLVKALQSIMDAYDSTATALDETSTLKQQVAALTDQLRAKTKELEEAKLSCANSRIQVAQSMQMVHEANENQRTASERLARELKEAAHTIEGVKRKHKEDFDKMVCLAPLRSSLTASSCSGNTRPAVER